MSSPREMHSVMFIEQLRQIQSSWVLVPHPASRHPLNAHTFTHHILPPLLCYYGTAVLVLREKTRRLRLILLPISIYLTFRACTSVDLGKGFSEEERLAYLSHAFILMMTAVAMRMTIWTFERTPYHRLAPSGSLALDALDLCCNFRGLGWSWSNGLKLAPETRPIHSRPRFLLSTLRSLLMTWTLFDISLFCVQSFPGFDSPTGPSIFDHSLDPLQRYTKSALITFLMCQAGYCCLNSIHLIFTLVNVLFLFHNPTEYPPAFHAPWFATSLGQFWSLCWHQFFRHIFISLGAAPLVYFLFGRVGTVIGTFFVSGILHYLALWGMGRGTDFVRVVGFFVMNGVGVVGEHAFKTLTGRRVGGVVGWVWVVIWVVGWAHLLAEAWLTRGLAGGVFQPQSTRPAILLARVLNL